MQLMRDHHVNPDDDLEVAIATLFRAYDLDESDSLSRDEFIKIAMRVCFERGEVFHEGGGNAVQFSLMDSDRSGIVDFPEFRERHLRLYSEQGLKREEIIEHLNECTKAVLTERVKMGPRFHVGIRQVLKRIFNLYDLSGDGALSPEEWIAAQKVVAVEIMDDLDETWIDEAAFNAMDSNGDGAIQLNEFLESSFQMFEGVKTRVDTIYKTLDRVRQQLEKHRLVMCKETEQISLRVQTDAKPLFRPPHASWQDEATEENPDANPDAWQEGAKVQLPVNLQTLEEVASIVRLSLKLPADTWFSLYVNGTSPDGDTPPVYLLRGDRPGSGNVQSTLEWFTKPNALHRIYVKNVRVRPKRLGRQTVCYLDEREAILRRFLGGTFGLSWQTQVLGDGSPLPRGEEATISVGDAIMVEVPKTDNCGEYKYYASIYMDGMTVLSRPIEEFNSGAKKKAKKGGKDTELASDQSVQFFFVALAPGKCIFFIDLGWEDQEEKLAAQQRLITPVAENSIARIGPLEVTVSREDGSPGGGAKAKGGKAKERTTMWWTGDKWSAKKPGAKAKKKKG